MNLHTMSNGAIELEYKNKTYKIKKLSLLDLFGIYEQEVKQEYMKISEMVKLLPDSQKSEVVRSAIKEMPSGKKLEEAVSERMDTAIGGVQLLSTILNKCQQVNTEDVMEILTDKESKTFVQQVISYALNQEMPKSSEESSAEKNVLVQPVVPLQNPPMTSLG